MDTPTTDGFEFIARLTRGQAQAIRRYLSGNPIGFDSSRMINLGDVLRAQAIAAVRLHDEAVAAAAERSDQ